MVLVRPIMCPDTTATAPNSPMARPLQSNTPYNRPHLMLGKVTNKVAMITPGTAKMILMSCCASQGPNTPCNPNSRTNTMPTMTGDTENGTSMSVISRFLPVKLNLVIAHAAATPNTVLIGTTISAVSNVSRIAACASGSLSAAQ